MTLTPKEKWVVDRLKREGYQTFGDYSPEQILLWKPIQKWASFNWDGVVFFYMDRKMGCWLHIRPSRRQQVHIKWYISWPTKKNWEEIAKAEAYLIEQENAPV